MVTYKNEVYVLSYDLYLTDASELSSRIAIGDALLAFNASFLGAPEIHPLCVLIRSGENSSIVGGLWGRTSFKWFFIELLFVPEALRSQGVGTQLIQRAEAEAQQRGCIGTWLDTFSGAAQSFYEKRGYGVFGRIDDYPPGNSRYFMVKRF